MVLLFLIVLGFSSIETFSRRGLMATARRAEIQGEVSYVLNHIAKQATRAIGAQGIPGQQAVDLTQIAGDDSLRIYVDAGADHESVGDGIRATSGDCWRAYRYRNELSPPADRYQIWYYPDYNNPADSYEVLARKIRNFRPFPISNQNYFEVEIIACWDPSQSASLDNPCITSSARISMPSVSAR